MYAALGLYIHFPFCVRKCSYCDFLSAPGGDAMKSAYTDALVREIRAWKKVPTVPVDTVFLGGGTPSVMDPEDLQRVMDAVRDSFTILPDAEITMEMNPGVYEDRLFSFLSRNVNRVSCGLQSVHSNELKKLGRTGIERSWLREFEIPVARPDRQGGMSAVPWDWLPQDWLRDPRLLSAEHWTENEVFKAASVGAKYENVIRSFDALLSEHGYERDGRLYRVRRGNDDTLAFVCHFGLIGVLLSHLLNCSPMVLWQGLALPPSSVTTVHTEERRPGIAVFRAASVGDISHLYAAGVEPTFSARFCTQYGNGQRQD